MRIISLLITIFLVSACVGEIKPYLKPAEPCDIPGRIANQEKWIKQDINSKALTYQAVRPVLEELKKIKEKYNRLQSAGTLTEKDSKEINRRLDKTSDDIFRLTPQKKALFGR